MIKTDRLAILLATYNGEKYLEEQLDSLLAQTNKEWTTYIHDDGSTDKTELIIDRYCELYPEQFKKITGGPTGGAKNNFYYLLREIEAPSYMFCDQDDVWLQNKIEKSINLLDKKSVLPEMVFTDLTLVDSSLNVISSSMWNYYGFRFNKLQAKDLIVRNLITGCTMVINHKLRDMMIKSNNQKDIAMHDKWAGLIATEFGKIHRIEESTILYRQHESNAVGAANNHTVKYWVTKFKCLKDIRESYKNTQKQAKEFSKVFQLPESNLITIYGNIQKYNKFKRIYCYIKYGFITNSISQIIGMILCG